MIPSPTLLIARILLVVSIGACAFWGVRPDTGLEPWVCFITALGSLATTFVKDRFPALAVKMQKISCDGVQWGYWVVRNNGDATAYDVEMTVTVDDPSRTLHNRQVITVATSHGAFPRASMEPGEQLEIESPRGDHQLLMDRLRYRVKLTWRLSPGSKSIHGREFHISLSQFDTAMQVAAR